MNIFKKHIQIIILTSVLVLTFMVTYMQVLKDINRLPTDGWSKEIELFEIDRENDGLEYNKDSVEFLQYNDSLISFYSKSEVLKFKRYDMSFNLVDEGDLLTAEEDIKNIHASIEGENITIILENDRKVDFYTISNDLSLISEENTYQLETNIFNITNGSVITRDGNGLNVLSGQNNITLELEGDYYNVKSSFKKMNDEMRLTYLSLVDGVPTVVLSIYDDNGENKEHIILSNLISADKRLELSNLTSFEGEDAITVMVNVTDKKSGFLYLNYFKYSLDSREILHSDVFENLRGVKNTVNQGEIICTVSGKYIPDRVEQRYLKSQNLVIVNFEEKYNELLTRTMITPIKHTYFSNEGNNYLVWSESYDGIVRVYYSTDSLDNISYSQKYDKNKFKLALFEMFDMAAVTIFMMVAISVIVFLIVMLPVSPFYFGNISFVERNSKIFLGFMIVLHNIIIIISHNSLSSKVEFPLFLSELLPILLLLINVIAIYNYGCFKRNKQTDNLITNYFTFFIPYIALYSSVITPYMPL